MRTIRGKSGARMPDDEATITLAFANGSMGTIHYVANGHESFPKERIEGLAVTVFCGWTISRGA